jgi:hypothetical protein
MCERKGWHKVGERPSAAVGCSTWGVDEVGGGTHPVGQRQRNTIDAQRRVMHMHR